MSTPGERLSVHKQVLRNPTGNEDVTYRSTPLAAEVDCAIEITEALIGLKVAVDSMANQVATVMVNLTAEINKATAQAVISSNESTKVAHESATLSRKLNRLTFWIVLAALVSAAAAGVQAWGAWYAVHHPQQVSVPASLTAPLSAPLPLKP